MSTSGDIKTIVNHQVKNDIAMLVDWWEHAWALDYQHDKGKYLNNMWRIIIWDIVNVRLT
jgi:superoxide dismutase